MLYINGRYKIKLMENSAYFQALVYTSTIFSNSNRKREIEEIIYKLPFKAEEAAQLSR